MLEHRLLHGRLASQQGPQACQKFLQTERLGQVVVGAHVEPADAVLHRVARTKDQHGFGEACPTPFAKEGETIAVRQPEIQHDGVITGLTERLARLSATSYPSGGVSTLDKRLLKKQTK